MAEHGREVMDRTAAAASFDARYAGWLTVGFMADVGNLGRMGAGMLDALLVAGVLDANVNRLNRDPALQTAHATLDSAPPDELRRPISINALAGALGLPFETVRRHVNKLVRGGALAVTPHGVYVPLAEVVSPAFVAASRARYGRVLRFYDDLSAVGAVEPIPSPPPAPDHPHAPIRAVGRLLSDYFFRTLAGLQERTSDPLTAMLILEISRASTEHIPSTQVIAAMRAGWIPDTERTPARVAELSRRLGIPYETTRRHVGWLTEAGICRRVGGGYLLASEYRERASLPEAAFANLANIRRMFRQIAALDASADGDASRGQFRA